MPSQPFSKVESDKRSTPGISDKEPNHRESQDPFLLPICSPSKEQQANSPLPKIRVTDDQAGEIDGGRYWDRTSDLFGVNEALSR